MSAWTNLKLKFNITIPKKVHIIETHLKTYLKEKKTTLHQLSGQTMENTHQRFEHRMNLSKYKVKKKIMQNTWSEIEKCFSTLQFI